MQWKVKKVKKKKNHAVESKKSSKKKVHAVESKKVPKKKSSCSGK